MSVSVGSALRVWPYPPPNSDTRSSQKIPRVSAPNSGIAEKSNWCAQICYDRKEKGLLDLILINLNKVRCFFFAPNRVEEEVHGEQSSGR